jgi:type I restriction enzyme R subunit
VGTYGGQHDETPGLPIEQALEMLREKVDIVRAMLHRFDASGFASADPAVRLETLAAGADHILGLDNGKKRFLDAMAALNRAAGIALHLEAARDLRDEIAFYQAVGKNLRKYATSGGGTSQDDLNLAIRQIVSGAVASDGVIDIFAAAGLSKPDISILSEEFLQTLKTNPHRNLQIELLKKLLTDEITAQSRRNVVQARKFSEMLERTLNLYNNRSLEAAEVILELIELARQMRDAPKRGDSLGLNQDEMAFYDALIAHGGVREVMGDATLATIAHELVDVIRRSVTIDWTQKESVRARMRTTVKRLLRRHGYPPDRQEAAVVTVIEQAEQLCRDWDHAA